MCTFSHGKSIWPFLWHFRVFIFAISGYTYFEMITAGALITEMMGELKENLEKKLHDKILTHLTKDKKSNPTFENIKTVSSFWWIYLLEFWSNFWSIFFMRKKLRIQFLMIQERDRGTRNEAYHKIEWKKTECN